MTDTVKIDGVEIPVEKLREAGYVKAETEFEYPLIREWGNSGVIYEFRNMTVVKCLAHPNDPSLVGMSLDGMCPHTDPRWHPCDDPRKLYCGYTEEQWRHIMKCGYLCEYPNSNSVLFPMEEKLITAMKSGLCKYRPARRRGILCPHFGGPKPEWVDGTDRIDMRLYNDGNRRAYPISAGIMHWDNIREFMVTPREVR